MKIFDFSNVYLSNVSTKKSYVDRFLATDLQKKITLVALIGIVALGTGYLLYHTFKYALGWNSYRRHHQNAAIEIPSRKFPRSAIPATPSNPAPKVNSENGKKDISAKMDVTNSDPECSNAVRGDTNGLLDNAQAAETITTTVSALQPENPSPMILEEDCTTIFPGSTSANDQIPISHESSLHALPMADFPPKQLTPLEEVVNTCKTIWNHASHQEENSIKDIFEVIVKAATVVKWEPTEKSNEFLLDLAKEVHGAHPMIPIGNFILKKQMKITFSEEEIPEWPMHRKVIIFSDKGFCHRVGIGWFSKETALDRIVFHEGSDHQVRFTIEASGKKMTNSTPFVLDFLNKIHWQ